MNRFKWIAIDILEKKNSYESKESTEYKKKSNVDIGIRRTMSDNWMKIVKREDSGNYVSDNFVGCFDPNLYKYKEYCNIILFCINRELWLQQKKNKKLQVQFDFLQGI